MRFRHLAEQMIPIEKRIAKEKGPMNLFALFEHEDSAGYVDVIVAADWASSDEVAARRYVAKVFAECLELEDRFNIGPIFIFDPKKEGVDEAGRLARVEHGLVEVRDEEIYGAGIRRGYFITSSWPANDEQTRKASRLRRSSPPGTAPGARRARTVPRRDAS